MAALHTEQLEYLLTHLATRLSATNPVDSLGVFPANCIPSLHTAQQRCRDVCFIVNTDPHDKPGAHWLAFYYDCTRRTLEYFDSYGLNIKQYRSVYSTIESRNLPIVSVNDRGFLQDVNSTACGYYCVVFLNWRIRFKSGDYAKRKLERLGDTPHKRDVAVVKCMHKLMHSVRCVELPRTFTRLSQQCCAHAHHVIRK
jgi:Adenovirus endoprotease